jgi:hypothetical protein
MPRRLYMFQNFIKHNNWHIQLLFVEYFQMSFNVEFELVLIDRNVVFGQVVREKNGSWEAV